MKEIIYNKNNLTDKDINRITRRAKAIIINSNDEVLLAYRDNYYHFPGGRVEENETFDECIIREIQEETGIILSSEKRVPFMSIKYITKDYPEQNINTLTINNYYIIKTNLKVNLGNTDLTEDEINSNFILKLVHKNSVLKLLEENLKNSIKENTSKDTIIVMKEYLKIED